MNRIKVLDRQTAEQIAAGEVIESPVSVVKELVENSLDAEAEKIEVSVEQGGKETIVVTDDGSGMVYEELPVAFKRFATSKVTTFDDLSRLKSLGFRGEALPSIAAVSKIELVSRQENSLSGSRIKLVGGEITSHEEIGAPPGTRVIVRELFYNTPGRHKFMRAASYETSKISTLLTEMALAHPKTAFSLQSNGRTLFRSSGDGSLINTLAALYDNETAKAMLELFGRDRGTDYSLQGFVSAPHLSRSTRKWIIFIVNGRLIKNAMLLNALERAYGDLLPTSRHPLAVVYFNIPPGEIDVNVHPTKTEIRFLQPDHIKTFLYKNVRLTLHNNDTPIQKSWEAGIQVREKGFAPSGLNREEPSYSPERVHRKQFDFERFKQNYIQGNAKSAEQEISVNSFEQNCAAGSREEELTNDLHEWKLIGQHLNSYIIVQKGENLLIIDQHAAHERIIYESLQRESDPDSAGENSQLTLPINIEVPTSWRSRIDQTLPFLREAGFEMEALGEDNYVIRAVPFMMRSDAGQKELYDLLENIFEAEDSSALAIKEKIFKTIACHRSIKAKQKLSREEMEKLLDQLKSTPRAFVCPHGRPTIIRFDRRTLERGFHRAGESS